MLITDQMPDLRQYERAGEKVQALAEYLYAFRQRLNHVLSNLDADNLSTELRESITAMESAAAKVEEQLNNKAAKVAAWPVGAVYLTAESEQDPAQALGGKWTTIETAIEGVTAWKRTE